MHATMTGYGILPPPAPRTGLALLHLFFSTKLSLQLWPFITQPYYSELVHTVHLSEIYLLPTDICEHAVHNIAAAGNTAV